MKLDKQRMIDNLKNDIKTLNDISAMLEKDGRFKSLPKILGMIAADIERSIEWRGH